MDTFCLISCIQISTIVGKPNCLRSGDWRNNITFGYQSIIAIELKINIYQNKIELDILLTKSGPGQIAILLYPLKTGRTIEGGGIPVSLVILHFQYNYLSVFFLFFTLFHFFIQFTLNYHFFTGLKRINLEKESQNLL